MLAFHRDWRLAVVGCLALAVMAACGSSIRATSLPGEAEFGCHPRCMVIEELRRRATAHPAPDSASVRFREEASMVIPRMRYVWGEYVPRRTVHARFVALVAVMDTALLVRDADDFSQAFGPFLVVSPDEAVHYCEEILYTTSRKRIPGLRPRAYTGPASLDRLPLQIPDSQLLNDSLSVPSAQVDADGIWRVDLWVIEPRDVVRVSCTISTNQAQTTVQDSFPGFGYLLR